MQTELSEIVQNSEVLFWTEKVCFKKRS